MKQIIYSLLLLVCVGCSKSNEEEPPTYLQLSGPLFSYFYLTEPIAGPIVPLDTLYIGETYKVSLYPCSTGEGSELIEAATYYLNGVELEVAKNGAFAGSYTVTVEPGSYTLSCKPVFISEYIIWESQTKNIVVVEEKNQEPPKQEVIAVTGVAIQLSDNSGYFPFIRKNLVLGNRLIVSSTVYPENATNKEVSITNSNENVASIELLNNEYNIIPLNTGFTEITVTSVDGSHTATCELSVCEIDTFTEFDLVVGTEGNSVTGFYSYIMARFNLNTVTNILISINEIKIINDTGEVVLTESNIPFNYGQLHYQTSKIKTSEGLQTYPANGWKAEVSYYWNNKEYNISESIK